MKLGWIRGSQGQGRLDPQVQTVTLTLKCGIGFAVTGPSTPESGESPSSSLSALCTCRNSRTEGGKRKETYISEVTKITIIEMYSL